MEILLGDFLARTIETAQQGASPVRAQDAFDSAQRAVPKLFLVIVHQINDGIALGEPPSFQFRFRGGRHRVQRRIDIPDPACPSLGHGEDLRIITSAPLREDTEDVIHDIAITGLDKAHAGTQTGKRRQWRHNAVPDLERALRDAARLRLAMDLNKLHFGNVRTDGKDVKHETEADWRQLIWIANQQ